MGIILSVVFFSCEKEPDKIELRIDEIPADKYYESEIFDGIYLELYGKWKLYGVSGGFHGGGHEINFDFLEVQQFGIYGFIRNDSILEFGKIKIHEQTNEELLITFEPDDHSGVFMFDSEKYIDFFDNDTVSFNSPCCDRYNYHFERVK